MTSTKKVIATVVLIIESDEQWENKVKDFFASSGNNIIITLYTPDGDGTGTIENIGGDIISLNVDYADLVGDTISMIESCKGSRILSGKMSHTTFLPKSIMRKLEQHISF